MTLFAAALLLLRRLQGAEPRCLPFIVAIGVEYILFFFYVPLLGIFFRAKMAIPREL